MLSAERLEELRQRLLRRVDELNALLGADQESERATRELRGGHEVLDPGEMATTASSGDVDLEREAQHIREGLRVQAALHRLALGDYGHCLDCNQEIDAARLLADAAVERCRACQQAFELSQRKRHGDKIAVSS